MLQTIIKRDGHVEPFTPSKLNQWGQWAAATLGDAVDWPSAVLDTVSAMSDTANSRELQQQLIRTCLNFDTWSYNRMAGRLYATLIRKDLYRNDRPTVLALHRKLQALGLMEVLAYSDAEYAQVEALINHERDFDYAHYQLHTHLTKYAIADRVNGVQFESPQFIYMRMAMALAVDQPAARRMHDVACFYEHLSNNRINAPTPNHVNLGTPLRGYASCCLYTVDDNARSIAVGNHIANTMTYMSAGIGAHMQTRSVNDPVRGGVIRHQGKLPYYRALVAEVKSNLQNGRGGACTTYFSIFDPEVDVLLRLKNPMSTEDKKIRGMDYSWGGNRFFARKVARNEDVFLFNCHTAPALQAALYSADEAHFEQLYAKYEQDDTFAKTWVNARELLITASNEWNETGRIYEHNIAEMNRHTPFKDTIFSSNL
ncbi:MAG TPA: ribonucleotide reductase N-terminal alpha domain-containing protein, partial [Thermomonas sp.]|nr:ribonucleotide reductase N-terminal alpha domain-containing protein [Thermomonas sp.]